MKSLAIVIFFMLIISIEATYYEDCGSVTGTVERVDVSGCDGNNEYDRCDVIMGEKQTIKIKFKSKVESKSVTAKCSVTIFNVRTVTLPLNNTNGCKNGISCPIQKQKDYTYTESSEIPTGFPAVSLDVKYELLDENEKDLVCVKFPINLKSKEPWWIFN